MEAKLRQRAQEAQYRNEQIQLQKLRESARRAQAAALHAKTFEEELRLRKEEVRVRGQMMQM